MLKPPQQETHRGGPRDDQLLQGHLRHLEARSGGLLGRAAKEIDWFKPATQTLEVKNGLSRWFVGAETNTCWNALDRHVKAGHGARTALIYDSAMLGRVKKFTYAELLEKVSLFAGVLQRHGIEKGDRVLIYMPMVPQAAVAMLACARLGAIHSVVFGGFAPKELATRIDDATPKLIVSASCGLEPGRVIAYKPLMDKAIEMSAHKVSATIVFQREMEKATLVAGRDFDWKDEMDKAAAADARPDCVSVAATDPLYVLYTSGTTGKPKGVVRDNGGHMVALKWSMKNVYDIDPGDTFWAASDVGWVVGHSYIVYGPLVHGCTTILFEGKPVGTPDAGTYWRIIAEHGVKAMFTALHRLPCHPQGRPAGRTRLEIRPHEIRGALSRRRARRSRHDPVGRKGAFGPPGHRSLVADRERLADGFKPDGHRAAAGQIRFALRAAARL